MKRFSTPKLLEITAISYCVVELEEVFAYECSLDSSYNLVSKKRRNSVDVHDGPDFITLLII